MTTIAAPAAPVPETPGKTTVELTMRGRLLVLLACLALFAAWLSGEANARLAAALLLAPLLVDFALVPRRLHRLRLAVRPRRTVAAAAFREEVEMHGERPLRDVIVHEPRTALPHGSTLVDHLRRGRNVVQLQARSNQRSHLLERVLVLQCEWPFGFFAARAALRTRAELVTEPGRLRLPARLLESLHHAARADRDSRTEAGPDFHCLREHQPDEDARGVHPLRSAALGTLVRRMTRGSMPREVGIVLDLRRPPGRNLRLGQRCFEWSLSACASMLDRLRAEGASVRLLVLDARSEYVPVAIQAQHLAFLTLLSEAGPVPHRPLDEGTLQALAQCDQCYWIPAGSHSEPAEMQRLRIPPVVVSEEPR